MLSRIPLLNLLIHNHFVGIFSLDLEYPQLLSELADVYGIEHSVAITAEDTQHRAKQLSFKINQQSYCGKLTKFKDATLYNSVLNNKMDNSPIFTYIFLFVLIPHYPFHSLVGAFLWITNSFWLSCFTSIRYDRSDHGTVNVINNKHLFIFALCLFIKHCNPLVNTFWILYTKTPKLVPRESYDVKNIH